MMKRITITISFVLLLFAAALLLSAQPAAAQGSVWTAQYYNNGFLIEPPVITRQEGALGLNWGQGSPGTGIGNDNFSARFATDVSLAAGTYRFWLLADDGVKLTINFALTPAIDTYNSGSPGQLLVADVTIPGGNTHIQVDYREVLGDAYVFIAWANAATNPQAPNFPVAVQSPPINTSAWTAQYYNNTTLSGSPSQIISVNSPGNNWGSGSPAAVVPVDNFSARFTSTQTLNAGNYRITTRADDGVRVWVDGVLYIDRFGLATGQTYTVDLFLNAGQHTFMVEYVEYGGVAFLDYALTQLNAPAPQPATPTPPVTSPTGVTGVVNTARLNVRQSPDPINGAVLTRISRGETYAVLGQFNTVTYGVWYQLNINGLVGWVNGRYINLSSANVPVITPGGGSNLPGTGYTATTRGEVNLRNLPTTQGSTVLARIPQGITVPVLARNTNATWWLVTYNGITGWVSGSWAILQQGADLNRIPIQN